MSVQQLLDFLNKSPAGQRQIEESKLQIVVLQPGSIGGTPVVGVEQAHFGFDWDARKLLLYPLQPLTRLAPEDVAAIHKSAKAGQSWHAYQQYTRQADRIKALEADLKEAAATLRRYETLHRAKGTAESTEKAEVNAALATRFEATIAKATKS